MTKEEILSFELYCKAAGISIKKGLDIKGITFYKYYKSKRILQKSAAVEISSTKATGRFIPMIFNSDNPPPTKSRSSVRREK